MATILPFRKKHKDKTDPEKKADLSTLVNKSDFIGIKGALENSMQDVNVTDFIGCLLIHYAAEMGDERIVQVLIDHGAFIDEHNCEGKTPLMLAAKLGHYAVARTLLENGADADVWSTGVTRIFSICMTEESKTAHDMACDNGHCEVAKLIKEYMND